MAINKKVNTKFTASGDLTKRFGLMDRAVARFGRSADKSFRRANKGASRFSATTKSIVAGLGITRGIAMLTQGIGRITSGFVAFDKAALGATVRFKDIGPEAANFNDQLKIIRKSARDAGATTEFTAAQAAASLDFLARAGFTSAEAMGALGSMINLATASGEEFSQVADMSSDLLGAFGLNAKNTAQKITNLNRLNDVLVKSANSANVTIESMFETMKIAAPIATDLGIELEEVAAMTAIMGNAGIKGTMAATALKNSFLNLSTSKKPVMDMLQGIGVQVDDGTGNMRKFTDILGDVAVKTKDMGQLKRSQVFDTLFGKRAIAGASNLARNIEDVREFEKMLKNSGNTAKLTAEIMRTSIDAKLKSLGSAATEAGFKILSAFEVDGKNGIDSLTQAIREADFGPFIDSLKVIADLLGKMAKFTLELGGGIGVVAAKVSLENDRVNNSEFEPSNFFKGLFSGERKAPNGDEAKAKAFKKSTFTGRLDIAGAPQGSTLTTGGDFEGFDAQLLGQN